MIRPRKGAVVEWFEHEKTRRRAPIRLDKGSMMFFAREDDADPRSPTFESKNGSEVRTWLRARLALTTDAMNMTWVPVVEVQQKGESGGRFHGQEQQYNESLEITIDRYYIGLTHDQREWRKLPWAACHPGGSTVVPENERYAESDSYGYGPKAELTMLRKDKPFRLPQFRETYRGAETVMAYTDDLWRGLMAVVKSIAGSRKLVDEMIGTKDGIETLTLIGQGKAQLLLTEGKK